MEKNNYPWELLDATTIMIPTELIAYHLRKYEIYLKEKKLKEAKKEIEVIKSYLSKEQTKGEREVCLKK